jgi:hypothetical protein
MVLIEASFTITQLNIRPAAVPIIPGAHSDNYRAARAARKDKFRALSLIAMLRVKTSDFAKLLPLRAETSASHHHERQHCSNTRASGRHNRQRALDVRFAGMDRHPA